MSNYRNRSVQPLPLQETILLTAPDGHVKTMAEIEEEVLVAAAARYPNRTELANRLGIGRSTLYRKLNTIGAGD